VAICAISDNIVTGDKLNPEARQSSLTEMVELSLDVAVSA
jgi:purine-nucleoside phosphorylase